MRLRPVTFHYKSDQNTKGRALQYGLIAEEVAQVAPGLVARTVCVGSGLGCRTGRRRVRWASYYSSRTTAISSQWLNL